jgi:lysophospholipase L1-like esterase
MRIRVLPGTPAIMAMADTTLSSLDTVVVTCQASDQNGTIVSYLWSFSGAGWDDSTSVPFHTLRYAGRGTVSVVIGARDNDGLVSTDTVVATFNRPPDSIEVRSPGPRDTLTIFETVPACTVSFSYSASDPDNDPVTYTLSWGPALDSLTQVYLGRGRSAAVPVTRHGLYFWRLVAQDGMGHSRMVNGTTVVLKVYRICFIGHSIVAGWGGDSITGGFRGSVLDSLRKALGPYERVKAVGPSTTSFMRGSAVDDSSMAVSGVTAREILLMLVFGVPQFIADIWVFMVGVNDQYSMTEQAYATYCMNSMIYRNPGSRLYALNGLAVPPQLYVASYYLPIFNQRMNDSIAVRSARGEHVFLVDAYTALSNDGQFDSTWFTADGVHPNQQGYQRLAGLIVGSMRTSVPPAVNDRP